MNERTPLCDHRYALKLTKNSVTYLMNGP